MYADKRAGSQASPGTGTITIPLHCCHGYVPRCGVQLACMARNRGRNITELQCCTRENSSDSGRTWDVRGLLSVEKKRRRSCNSVVNVLATGYFGAREHGYYGLLSENPTRWSSAMVVV
eukprot:scaffold39069_cov154-Skeletonema_marinoi.AAC.3